MKKKILLDLICGCLVIGLTTGCGISSDDSKNMTLMLMHQKILM